MRARVFGGVALVWILSLVLLECACRSWIAHHGDALARARRVLRPDAVLGWRLRSDLDTAFEGVPLKTEAMGLRTRGESEREPTILVLGPSSAFGWGVAYDEAWPALFEKRLRGQGQDETVLNASQIGFSLIQGRLLYRGLKESGRLKRVHTVVIAYGVNDMDRWRFFDTEPVSDREYFSRARPVPAEIVSSLAASSLMFRAWQESLLYRDCGLEQKPLLRSTPGEFGEDLREFVKELAADGRRALVVTSARYFSPGGDSAKADQADALLRESVAASQSGDCAESRRKYRVARGFEPWRVVRDIDRLNREIGRVARESGFAVADVARALGSDGSGSSGRGTDFIDMIHLSVGGHTIAARVIAEAYEGGGALGKQSGNRN